MMNRLGSAAALAAVLIQASPVHAYNYATHKDIVNKAFAAMPEAVPPSAAPSGISQTAWNSYLDRVRLAPNRIGLLKTGLPAGVVHKVPDKCFWDAADDLSKIGSFRLREFKYDVQRMDPDAACGLKGLPGPNPGLVLGWHGANVDDLEDDSVLWYRPTSMAFLGMLKGAASAFWQIGAGAFLLPFTCIGGFLSGNGCDLDDSFDLAQKHNPIEYIEGWIPGFGSHRDSEYVGLWHFINVRSPIGRYNDIPGMFYPSAGPNNVPGTADLVIMVWSTATGLSLNADESDGDDHYGQYDRVSRKKSNWQYNPIALTEFSSLDNLAKYGFERFLNGKNDAAGLGWPLHALGDAAAPHHIAGTTSWGHRPYEDYVQKHWEELAPFDAAQRRRVLEIGFGYWTSIKASNDVRQLIQQLARKTSDLSSTGGGLGWAFEDSRSLSYGWFDKVDDNEGMRSNAIEAYDSERDRIRPLVEESMGATLGFLTYVSDIAQVTDCTGARCDPTTRCTQDMHFDAEQKKCVAGPATPPLVPPPIPVCGAGMSSPECPQGADAGSCGSRPTCSGPGTCPAGFFCSGSCCLEIVE